MKTTTGQMATPADVAAHLGTSVAQLAQMRYLGRGPKFVKVGRSVLYRWTDVEAYLDEQTFSRTGGVR